MTRVVDLSHVIEPGVQTYPGLAPPSIGAILTHEDSKGRYGADTEFHLGRIDMPANTGTYVDAPFHRYREGVDLADLPLEKVVDLPCTVVHASDRRDRAIDVKSFAGLDLRDRAVLFRTGWSAHWGTPSYFGPYPYLSAQAALVLVDAGVALVGIDSVNVDDAEDSNRPVHSALLAANIPVVEHLTSLEALPASGARFFVPPLRIRGIGSMSARAFAIITEA